MVLKTTKAGVLGEAAVTGGLTFEGHDCSEDIRVDEVPSRGGHYVWFEGWNSHGGAAKDAAAGRREARWLSGGQQGWRLVCLRMAQPQRDPLSL